MTISGEALAVATTSATLAVATQHLPIWFLAIIGLVGGLMSLVNTEKINIRSSINFLIAGASIAAILTNISLDFFIGFVPSLSHYPSEISIGLAFIYGILGHLMIEKLMHRKGQIVDAVVEKAINQIKK